MSILIFAAQVLLVIIAAVFVLFIREGWLAWKRHLRFVDMQEELRNRENKVRRIQQ